MKMTIAVLMALTLAGCSTAPTAFDALRQLREVCTRVCADHEVGGEYTGGFEPEGSHDMAVDVSCRCLRNQAALAGWEFIDIWSASSTLEMREKRHAKKEKGAKR